MVLRVLSFIFVAGVAAFPSEIATVHFPSEDGSTGLVGYVFEPLSPGPHPAIVLLHGRAGAYSSLAHGVYDATTLSKRHKIWGAFWAERGYVAVLVDSFGPRGYPAGFGAGSYKDRPAEVSEQTVRPLDAYGALRYLRSRNEVIKDRIGVQGWSNGGMTVLVTMSERAPGRPASGEAGFRAAIAEYPGCGMEAVQGKYRSYAPLLMMVAGADEEVSPQRCEAFARQARENGNPLQFIVYPGASHNFDDPSKSKQSIPANHDATDDAMRRAESFFAEHLLSSGYPGQKGK
jgi:carboxymethylenebutenolidase